jgi:putative phosphoribosyl transferase
MKQFAIQIPAGTFKLSADVSIPAGASSLVLFSGPNVSRSNPTHRQLAEVLHEGCMGTVDLLTEAEAHEVQIAGSGADLPVLVDRLTTVADWISQEAEFKSLGLGIFGMNSGAAAAFMTAAERPLVIRAVVSCGGLPDLAQAALKKVKAPSLVIVECKDITALRSNYAAVAQLPKGTERKLETFWSATHLLEDPRAFGYVAALARDWFYQWLPRRSLNQLGQRAA